MTLQEAFEGDMIRCVAIFTGNDPDNFAVMDRRIKLLETEDVACDGGGVVVVALDGRSPLIDQAKHSMLDEASRFLADRRPVNAGGPTPGRHRRVSEHNVPNDFIVMLHGIGKTERQ